MEVDKASVQTTNRSKRPPISGNMLGQLEPPNVHS